jgi:hypothetical protein
MIEVKIKNTCLKLWAEDKIEAKFGFEVGLRTGLGSWVGIEKEDCVRTGL